MTRAVLSVARVRRSRFPSERAHPAASRSVRTRPTRPEPKRYARVVRGSAARPSLRRRLGETRLGRYCMGGTPLSRCTAFANRGGRSVASAVCLRDNTTRPASVPARSPLFLLWRSARAEQKAIMKRRRILSPSHRCRAAGARSRCARFTMGIEIETTCRRGL